MKHLLTLVSIVFCLNVNGQKDTTTWRQFEPAKKLSDSTYTGDITFEWVRPKPEYDTVKVILLFCDTSIRITGNDYGLFPNPVGWRFGYEVRPKGWTLSMTYGWEVVANEYLDEKKKPLPKNIVVWMAK